MNRNVNTLRRPKCRTDVGVGSQFERGGSLHVNTTAFSRSVAVNRHTSPIITSISGTPSARPLGCRGAPGPTDMRAQGTSEKTTSALPRPGYSTLTTFYPRRIGARVQG